MTARSTLHSLVSDRLVLAVIAINTISLIVRGFADHKDGASHPMFWVEYGCTLYFVFEMVVKLRLSGWRGYWSSSWNRIDAFLVIISTPILLEPFVDIPEDIALLLLLRLARLARLTRLVQFIPDRERLWNGLTRALRAALGVSVALALYCLVLALAACHLFHDLAPEHFGDPLIAYYSMFKVFTIEGWYEIPDTVAEIAPPGWALLVRLFFMGSVVSGGILGLSLANAIFVDEMVMDNNAEVEERIAALRSDVAALHAEVAESHAEIVRLLSARDSTGHSTGPKSVELEHAG